MEVNALGDEIAKGRDLSPFQSSTEPETLLAPLEVLAPEFSVARRVHRVGWAAEHIVVRGRKRIPDVAREFEGYTATQRWGKVSLWRFTEQREWQTTHSE